MPRNIGPVDRLIRLAFAALLLGLGLLAGLPAPWGLLAGLVGLALLVSGLLRRSLLYRLLGR